MMLHPFMKYTFLLFLPVLLLSCQPGTKKAEEKASANSTITQPSVAKTDNYVVLLKGTIGNFPVTMYLTAENRIYTGYYYYDSKEQPIYVSGDDTTNKGKTTLTAYQQDSSETFILSFAGNKANGSWTYNGNTLPVSLSEAAMPVTFSYHHWEDSMKLIDTLPSSPQATAAFSTIWPDGSSATDELIKTQIAGQLLPKTKLRNPDSIFHQSAKEFFDDYKTENALTQGEIDSMGDNASMYSYDLSDDVSLCYTNTKMMVLACTSSSYTGGAHGNYGTSYVPLNLVTNQVITLSQMLTPEGIQHLRALLESGYRRDNHLTASQPLTDGGVFENKIEPNKNFYATGKQLIFSYVPYEISSYAAGQIDIAIDMNDLQNYLQPSFKSLLP